MVFLPGIVLSLFAGVEDKHLSNPVYRELRQQGLAVADKIAVPLPAPLMADGLDAAAQKAVLDKLVPDNLESFLRKSPVAPQIIRLGDIRPSDPKAPAHGVDFYFVAYGAFKTLTDKEFLQRLLGSSETESQGKTLAKEDLEKRKISVTAENEKHEGFGHAVFSLFNKIQIAATGHTFWSQTADSIVVAGKIDPRFEGDPEFPNQWRHLKRDDDNKVQLAPPHPYRGAGYYLKITKLTEPNGALFVEGHIVFTEPTDWFEGANFLRSKLPITVQTQVRAMRRELLRGNK